MLTETVNSYLEVRRACGFALKTQSRLLCSFAAFSDARGKLYVSTETAIEWAALASGIPRRARLLGEVIRFARYARAEDPRHEVPPPAFGTCHYARSVPYILSVDEIRRLIQSVSQSGKIPFRRETYATLFSLIACTGLRTSEAINLRYRACLGILRMGKEFGDDRLEAACDRAIAVGTPSLSEPAVDPQAWT